MRYLAFGLAAVLSVVAIVGQWMAWPSAVTVSAIVVAGTFLVLGLWDAARRAELEPKELDEEQQATIRRMKSEGNTQLAIQQVQLWLRNTSQEEAAAIVRGV